MRGKAEQNVYRAMEQDSKLDSINATGIQAENTGILIQEKLRKQRDVITTGINTVNIRMPDSPSILIECLQFGRRLKLMEKSKRRII